MATRIHSNNYKTELSSSIDDNDLSMVVNSVAKLPTIGGGVECYLTLIGGGNLEIVKATSNSSTTITIERAQENTTAYAFDAGSIVSLRPTANSIDRKTDGAASATDNALARFDSTTGKIIQNSGVVVDDSNNVTGLGTINTHTIPGGSPGTLYISGGTDVSVADGGTGRSVTVAYAPIVGGTTTTAPMQSTASAGSSGQLLASAGSSAVPIWTTPTYPTTSQSSGKLLQSDGTNFVASAATWPTAATNAKFIIGNGTNYVESTSTIPTSAGSTALKHLKSDGTNYVLTTATISDTPSTAGKILVSDGTNWITSTPTFPNASATSGKRIKSDGTNWIASTTTMPDSGTNRKILVGDGTNYVESTETWAVPGTSGKILQSDGTNWTSATPTGTGTPVLATSPTLVTPVLGVATATSISFGDEALANYDEGTFTPTFTFATPGDLSVSYSLQLGNYIRIGKAIFFKISLTCTPTFTTSSGLVRVSGLPFTSASGNTHSAAAGVFYGTGVTYPVLCTLLSSIVIPANTYCQIFCVGSTAAGTYLQASNISSTVALSAVFMGTYFV